MYRAPWVADETGRRALRQVIATSPVRVTEPQEHLARLTMPTLVLWAEHDVVLPVRLGRRLVRDLPAATLEVMPGCGSFLQEERPAEVSERLRGFLV